MFSIIVLLLLFSLQLLHDSEGGADKLSGSLNVLDEALEHPVVAGTWPKLN
jgi:hypothetical protein